MPSNKIFWHCEGDSISAGDVWQITYRNQSLFPWGYFNYAVSGATVQGNSGNSVVSREQQVAARFVSNACNLLTVFIGANNFGTSTTATNDADMAALVAYCDRMRQRGFYVAVWTILPRGTGWTGNYTAFNDNRAIYNPQYRAMCGVNCHAIIDCAADPIMGPDGGSPYTGVGNAANNSTLFTTSDGTHPTSTVGAAHLTRIATPVLDTFARAATGGLLSGKGAFDFDTRRFRIVF